MTTRSKDRDLLSWVKLRCAGKSPTEIAKQYNTTADYVRAATGRVRSYDVAQSSNKLAGCYW